MKFDYVIGNRRIRKCITEILQEQIRYMINFLMHHMKWQIKSK